ncbi:MAG TPA: ArgR family transcriptional regulator, partial [Acidimicrobiales bacterium]|nr:ArgR family transcriptional regulator [Acidimicrobiales bacterium]
MTVDGGPTRVTRTRRQHVVGQLVSDQVVTSQEQLVELLAAEGIFATQATVSRDLEELGAVKVRMAGQDRTVYALPELP